MIALQIRYLSMALPTWIGRIIFLVRVRGINFRVSKGLQGECLQGEYKYIYGMKKKIVLI